MLKFASIIGLALMTTQAIAQQSTHMPAQSRMDHRHMDQADMGKDPCFCIFTGGSVPEGETACINTAKGFYLARCGKFLNNTSWIVLETPCSPDPQQTSQKSTSISTLQLAENNP